MKALIGRSVTWNQFNQMKCSVGIEETANFIQVHRIHRAPITEQLFGRFVAFYKQKHYATGQTAPSTEKTVCVMKTQVRRDVPCNLLMKRKSCLNCTVAGC